MLIAEYDYTTDIAVQRQEVRDKSRQERDVEIALNMLKDKVSIDAVSKYTGLSSEVIRGLQEQQQ